MAPASPILLMPRTSVTTPKGGVGGQGGGEITGTGITDDVAPKRQLHQGGVVGQGGGEILGARIANIVAFQIQSRQGGVVGQGGGDILGTGKRLCCWFAESKSSGRCCFTGRRQAARSLAPG